MTVNVSRFVIRWKRGIFPKTALDILSFMTKRLIEIDDELLAHARIAAGTDTIKATVEAALRRLVDQETALRHIARLRRPGALDVDQLGEARRPRTGTNG